MIPGLTGMYVREILRSPRFLTIVLGGVLLIIGNAVSLGSLYGTNTYPLTYKMLEVAGGTFSLFILIVTAIYAGELVFRERDTRIDDITDSTPAPTWLAFLAKLLTLFALQFLLMVVVLVCSIGVQLAKGYTRIELPHYLFDLFALQLPGFLLIAVFALTLHTLVNNKYLGHFVVLLLFLVVSRMPDFGFEDRLYRFASRPDIVYSDLNGYGHFLPAVFWFRAYWGAFAVLLLVLAYAAWVRGRDDGLQRTPARRGRADDAGGMVGRRQWRARRSSRPARGSTTTRTFSIPTCRARTASSCRPTTSGSTRRSPRRHSPRSRHRT